MNVANKRLRGVAKMKNKRVEKRNEFAILLEGLLAEIGKVLFGAAAVVGVFFAAGYMVDLLIGFVSLGAGMFVICAFAGLMILLDSRPGNEESYRARENTSKSARRRALCRR